MPAKRDSKGRFIKGPGGGGVRVVDRGWNKLVQNLARAPNVRAKVGVQGPAGEARREGGLTNAGLAAVHEFGSPARGIPERSFLRSTFDEKQKEYQKELDRVANSVLDGAQLEGEMLLIGEKYRADVIDKIHSGIPPPLADATIAAKGGEATPLIDTQQMLGSIGVVIEKGGK